MAGFGFSAADLDTVYLAIAVALSSTVVIVKLLYEKRELDTLPGRITLGILVLQDLFAILFLAVQPNLGHPGVGLIIGSLLKVLLLVIIAFAASRFALPPIFKTVARLPELVLVGALAWCFLIAGLAGQLKLSREMGALVAGVAISTFPYTLDVAAKVTSLRDFFVTLFFVSLGMLTPIATLPVLGWALLIVAFLVASRAITVFLPLCGMKQGLRASLLPSINLCQISELSLVIFAIGSELGHVSSFSRGIIAYAFVISAVGSATAISSSDGLIRLLIPWLKRIGFSDLSGESSVPEKSVGHGAKIFILGFSWTASSLLEEISRNDSSLLEDLVVVDFNPTVISELKRRKVPVIYGDITQRDTLLHAGIESAEVIICTIPNTLLKGATNLRLLNQIRRLNPAANVIMHAEWLSDVTKLYANGADYVSLPRLTEAQELFKVIETARGKKIVEKRQEQELQLASRNEVIS
jgi:Kef-type K+ transport system membrane component KefB/Trk K+ transport system NAD-binding subunit